MSEPTSDTQIFRFLAAAAASDGVVDDLEQELLLAGAQEFGISPGQVGPIVAEALADRRKPNLPLLDPAQQEAVLEKVSQVLLADGVMLRAEQRFLDRLQLVFGMDQSRVDRGVNAARKSLSKAERTKSGRLQRDDARAQRVPRDSEVVYQWRGGRIALGKDRLFLFSKVGHDREVAFDSVQAVHLEVDEGCCCVSLDVAGGRPLTITDEDSGGGAGHWTYVSLLTHLHDRLQRRRPGKVSYETGNASRFKSAMLFLGLDLLLGGLVMGAIYWAFWEDEPAGARIALGIVGVLMLGFLFWHVMALRSQNVARYDPAKGLPSGFLPGGRYESGTSYVGMTLLLIAAAAAD